MTDPDIVIDESKAVARGMDADSARNLLRNCIETIMAQALAWHEQPAGLRSEAPHSAIKITTGVGKSELIRQELIASFIGEAKARGLLHRVLIGVPTHKLADEAKHKMPAGITAMVWQGREGIKLGADEPMCRNLDAVNAALALGADVEETACKRKEARCLFYDTCHYQAQKPVARAADVVLFAQECLFAAPKAASKKVGLVIADESFWQDGLRGTETETENRLAIGCLAHELSGFPVRHRNGMKADIDTEHLHDLLGRLDGALAAMPDGYVQRAPLLKAGFLPATKYEDGSCALARKLEWRRMVDHELHPGASAEELGAAVKQFGFLGQLPRRAFMWWALGNLVTGNDDATGRLRIETVTTKEGTRRWLHLLERREIDERIAELPIVVSDSTMPLEIVRHYLPGLQVALELEVAAPHMKVTQVVGLPVGKSSMQPLAAGKRKAGEEARVAHKRQRLGDVVRRLVHGRRGLVITYKSIEDDFRSIEGVEVAHFNAIEGIDRWKDVEVLVIIGRPLPSPQAVENLAAAITGKPVIAGDMGFQGRAIPGTGHVLARCGVYAAAEAEMIRQAVTEAAIVQAVGRARGVNRTAANPVEIFVVLHDIVAPALPVDEVVRFQELEPDAIDQMAARALVPQWPGDAAKLCDDLFPSRAAAKKAYSRAGLSVGWTPETGAKLVTSSYKKLLIRECHQFAVRYRTPGRGSEPRLALVDPAKVPYPRAALEAALGPLVLFEMLPEPKPVAARPELESSAVTLSEPAPETAAAKPEPLGEPDPAPNASLAEPEPIPAVPGRG